MKSKSNIKQNGLRPLKAPKHTIPRERLNKLLSNNSDKSLMIVYSPAGYGKTDLVQNFLFKQKVDFAWLNASEEIDHTYSFFNYLVQSFRAIKNHFGDNTLKIIESRKERYQLSDDSKTVINEAVSTFIKEFKQTFKNEIFLVIDDFDNIAKSRWTKKTFNTLFDNIPKNLHIIIISRQIPDLNFIPFTAQGNILKIGMEDLIFRFNEIVELVQRVYSIECSEDSAKLLENNLGGWITGIHLMLQSYGKDFSNIKLDYQKIPENIFNPLANEMFKHLEPEIQNFLGITALFDNFTEELSNQVLGIKNSSEFIEKLLSKNLFINSLPVLPGRSTEKTKYVYNIMFKKFLLMKLNELISKDSVMDLLKRVCSYYKERGDIVSMINYLMLARDYNSAIPEIIENFMGLFDEGKFEFLWKWLTTIENEIKVRNPHIIFFLGVLYKYYLGDTETSLKYFENAIKLFKKQNDPHGLIKCHISRAGLLLTAGRTKDVINEISGLLKVETLSENKAGLLYNLAYAYYQNSEYDTSVKLLNQSLVLLKNFESKKIKTDISNLLGHINLVKGEFKISAQFYEEVLVSDPDILNKIETISNLVLLYSQSAKYENAKELLTKLGDDVNNFPIPILKMVYLLSAQGYYFEFGDYEKNIEILKEINSTALSMNYKAYIYLSNRLLSDTYYYTNNIPSAKHYINLAEASVDKRNELERIEIMTAKSLLQIKLKDEPKIEKNLLEAYNYYDTNQYIYSKAQLCFNLGEYYIKTGKPEEAKKYLSECFAISGEKKYLSYLNRQYKHCQEAFNFSLKNDIYKDFVIQFTK